MGLSLSNHCFPEYLCPLKIMSILSFVVLTCEEILQMKAATSTGCQDAHGLQRDQGRVSLLRGGTGGCHDNPSGMN